MGQVFFCVVCCIGRPKRCDGYAKNVCNGQRVQKRHGAKKPAATAADLLKCAKFFATVCLFFDVLFKQFVYLSAKFVGYLFAIHSFCLVFAVI